MPDAYPEVRLGDIVDRVQRMEAPTPGQCYRQIGVRLWGEGAYDRGPIDGAATTYRSLNRVENGDIVVNKIWARNGSVAVVDDRTEGCYGSAEFPVFVPNRDRLEPRWFHWYTKTRALWMQCDEKSRGTSGQNRMHPDRFLDVTIPLPGVGEQRRIVGRIEAVASRIEEARRLRREAEEELEALGGAMLFQTDEAVESVPLGALMALKSPDIQVHPDRLYDFAGVYSFGRGVFAGQRKAGSEISYGRLTSLGAGDFVYPKLMAWEGAFGVVPPALAGRVVSTEFPVFEVDRARVLPEVLDAYFKMPSVWPLVAGGSTGTNVRRRRLHPAQLLEMQFPLPSTQAQHRFAAVRRASEQIRTAQAETDAALQATIPSLIRQAFAGEL